ncbi:MAG: MarR family winged helix-turn-helix transcriptional regulator [Paracoccaceae bacterium]
MVLNRALDGVMPSYRLLFARYDLTEQQWRILRALWEVTDIRSADLAEQTLLPKPSLVGILDRLEARGLVVRKRSTTDRRAVCVAATAQGRALSQEVLPQAQAIHNHIRQLLPEGEWAALEATLDRLAERIKTTDQPDIAAE